MKQIQLQLNGKLMSRVKRLLTSDTTNKSKDEWADDLEAILIGADISLQTSNLLIQTVFSECDLLSENVEDQIQEVLRGKLMEILLPLQRPLEIPKGELLVILMIGVNGSGKTTSAGKLAHYFKSKDVSVLFGSTDTFRAAATEQLLEWGGLLSVDVIHRSNKEPAAIAFESISAAVDRNTDVLILDTAGRLPNQNHLIRELLKLKKVIMGRGSNIRLETVLTLDCNNGQNNLHQVRDFSKEIDFDSIILNKLDGTAKGGFITGLHQASEKPILFIGNGETRFDLQVFNACSFVTSLLE